MAPQPAFNRYHRSDDGGSIGRNRVYQEDQARWATLGNADSELVAVSAVDNDNLSAWGFDGRDKVDDDLEDEDVRKKALKDLRYGRYKFDLKRFEVFESLIHTLAKRNIKMLV